MTPAAMTSAGNATIERDATGDRVVARGDWTLAYAPALVELVAALRRKLPDCAPIDAGNLGRVDTAGARLLLDLGGASAISGLDDDRRALFDAVANVQIAPAAAPRRDTGLVALLARTGAATEQIAHDTWQLLGFIGLILATLARCVFDPRRWRVTSLAFHLEQTGLDAVPIVMLLNFMVGAVVAFVGATVLKDFGASIFTVELIGYSFLREFGVLLTAILIAGRSGS